MNKSERFERYFNKELGSIQCKDDEEFCNRIVHFLNDKRIDKDCFVDAYYYDYSVIPDKIKEKYNMSRDHYLIFGITDEGEMISRWVQRSDLDSYDS
jgi:hypothetical protein